MNKNNFIQTSVLLNELQQDLIKEIVYKNDMSVHEVIGDFVRFMCDCILAERRLNKKNAFKDFLYKSFPNQSESIEKQLKDY